MTRLPTLTSLKLLRALRKLGFQEFPAKGSHVFLQHLDGRTTTVPVHQGEDMGRGLLRKILRDIQMEPEQFKKFL